MSSSDKDATGKASGGLESRSTANIVRLGLALVGAVIVGVAIWLAAVRTPTVSSQIATYSGPAVPGAVPTKVDVTSARPSDTLLAALLALGGVLLVAGAVYPRLSSVEGPGFKVGLAALGPEARDSLTAKARHEADARGVPEKADVVADQAEKALLERFQYPPLYGSHSTRSPFTTTYGLGAPFAVAPAVTASDIDEAISAALDDVASTAPEPQ